VNARFKTVYVGITDPDPTVDGKGIKHLEDNGIKVTMFDRDLQKIIEDENREFRRQAKQRNNQAKQQEQATELEKPLAAADYSKFSEEALQKFVAEAGLDVEPDSKDFQSFLADIGAMKFDENVNVYRPTGIGILLFGDNPRAKFPNASLKAFVEYGGNRTEARSFDQPIVLIPDSVEEWLNKVLPLSKDTSSFKRKDIPAFPIAVLREAIINAIVHRDYEISGAKSSLEIDDDKIVVKSPGAPLPSISLEQLNRHYWK